MLDWPNLLDGRDGVGHIADGGGRSRGVRVTETRELVIRRVFNAPIDLVWEAWTDPKRAIAWWGPRAHPATHMEMDVRVGGTWRHCLTGVEDGRVLWQHGTFREVDEPERLVFTFVWDEEGERGIENLVEIE